MALVIRPWVSWQKQGGRLESTSATLLFVTTVSIVNYWYFYIGSQLWEDLDSDFNLWQWQLAAACLVQFNSWIVERTICEHCHTNQPTIDDIDLHSFLVFTASGCMRIRMGSLNSFPLSFNSYFNVFFAV